MSWYGLIEAGGTKFLCAVANTEGEFVDKVRLDTRGPTDTIQRVLDFFRPHLDAAPAAGLGVASFGPLDLDLQSATFGYITATPKPGWAQTDLLGRLQQHFSCPVVIDTDVNAAALAELRWGAGQGCDSLVYITVGTGVGGGLAVLGKSQHGLIHPEMGHMRVPRLEWDSFPGICPFHGDCVEGLCSGPAIKARCGQEAHELAADHPEWQRLGKYLGSFAANLILTISPQKLVFGGGVLKAEHLLPLIREHAMKTLNGYLQHPAIQAGAEDLITAPGLGADAGLRGALALALGAR